MSEAFANILRPLTEYSANSIIGQVTLSYFVFYTGFSKDTKSLSWKNLSDFLLLGRGLDWTLVEFNKLISLAGLTTMLISFIPSFKRQSRDLLWGSMMMLGVHSTYSMFKFYSFSPAKVLADKPIKKLSVALGNAGQVALSAGFFGYLSPPALAITATTFGIAHFWTMEVDYKYKLQVRPYAYLPFVLAIPALLGGLSRE